MASATCLWKTALMLRPLTMLKWGTQGMPLAWKCACGPRTCGHEMSELFGI